VVIQAKKLTKAIGVEPITIRSLPLGHVKHYYLDKIIRLELLWLEALHNLLKAKALWVQTLTKADSNPRLQS